MSPIITDIASAAAFTFTPSADEDRHDAAQRAALDARGAARLAGFDEPQQEAAAQSAFAAIAGTPESW